MVLCNQEAFRVHVSLREGVAPRIDGKKVWVTQPPLPFLSPHGCVRPSWGQEVAERLMKHEVLRDLRAGVLPKESLGW